MKKKLVIALLIFAAIGLGFLRDYVFVSINEQTGQGPSGSGELFIWKWPLTFVFASAYLGITCLFLHVLFAQKKYIRIAVFVYFLLFFVSFFAAGAGYCFSSFEKIYPFVRTIMGIAQSPIVMMILIPACIWNEFFMVDKKKQ